MYGNVTQISATRHGKDCLENYTNPTANLTWLAGLSYKLSV